MAQQRRQWNSLRQWQHAYTVVEELDRAEPVVVVSDGADLIVAWGAEEILAPLVVNNLDATIDSLTPGWWAGFIGFEAGASGEPTFSPLENEGHVPAMWLGRFAHQLRIPAEGEDHTSPVSDLLPTPPRPATSPHPMTAPAWELLHSSLNRSEYVAAVSEILEDLHAGVCFELNLTRRLTFAAAIDPLSLLRHLVTRHPAPHAAFLRTPDFGIVSLSPELLAAWENGHVVSRPIKGTSRDPEALSQSLKDRTENIITVDLARADLSRIAHPGSLHVSELCSLEAHPGLWHLVSTVECDIDADHSIGSVLAALLPAASITGAPKPRVLQRIRELEPVRRDAYCGTVGFLDTVQNRGCLNVAIRTFTHTDTATMLGVGGGITLASDPEREWEETELKADRLLQYVDHAWNAAERARHDH